MTNFALLITGSPYASQAHYSAQGFVEGVYQQGYAIDSVFFYGEAVNIANRFIQPPNDEKHLGISWRQLSERFEFPLNACISAANRRGVISLEEQSIMQLDTHSLLSPFTIVGLGSWVEAAENAERIIQFN
ncbi:sulfurtransferase complex subunit TusD [Pleionea litopenaei]|uniref:Sulfurtransferase complex subunit TusD n=1 Tax=Pleionea litopenaei TaxID=3070815 RepID=A0AA51RUY8_9GAMM|nr:sulfurtransferase complex subunit TusD [Pleionea sp. HL-JVS1]WMS88082.1 sulfurtransferase complex subunit TusD [Pleionea sp. HL-JVS1]